MIRIHTDNYVPKYINGIWQWNVGDEKIQFESLVKGGGRVVDNYLNINGFHFKNQMNQIEEMIFRQEFQRSETAHDADVILMQDIKNLVLYLSPAKILSKNFIRFVHTKEVDRFFKALVIYFEYFLKMVEFVLIRRDEIAGPRAKIQSGQSIDMKRVFSCRLTQYRLILAREYSIILLGEGDMATYYHITPIINISKSIRDQAFHEAFLAFSQHFVRIALHRRAYDVIDSEMGRLFRSEHFRFLKKEKFQFTKAEANLMYGRNYKRANYRAQNSPLIQELTSVEHHNLPLLWIGERKYRGTDERVTQLELEYIVPDSQLCLIDVVHGILGHPKKLYNTMLQINWEAVRQEGFDKKYDPYFIVRQPCLEVPEIEEEKLRKQAKKFETYYQIVAYHEKLTPKIHKKWYERDRIVDYFKTGGLLVDVWNKCEHEVHDTSYGRSVDEIIAEFIAIKKELRKK